MTKEKKKPQRLRARLPRGFSDRMPGEIRATKQMMARIREVYERYGFDPLETPLLEYSDVLGKFLPDDNCPNKGVFSLSDDDDQWLSLRYDLTAPLARHFAENFNALQMPYRTYREGWVFRNEKPGPGRFRQFMQFDADIIGAPSVSADAEMCMMMVDSMEALGISRGDYLVRVNNRKLLDAMMEAMDIDGTENSGKRLSVLRAIDKLDRLGEEGVRALLGEGRKDESGDFTPGAGLNFEQIEIIIKGFLHREHGNFPTFETSKPTPFPMNDQYCEAINELQQIQALCHAAGYGDDQIAIDPSIVRGLEYYTGLVYECELTFPVTNEKGERVQFGSVAGGGRYNGLVQRFRGESAPATGFSIGVSRLMRALKNLGKLEIEPVLAPVMVCVMERDYESLCDYQSMTQSLRRGGIRAEMYQG